MIAPTAAFEVIAESGLLALAESRVGERRTIEYKREFPAGGDEAKRDFLADASSFATAGGGDPGLRNRSSWPELRSIPRAAQGMMRSMSSIVQLRTSGRGPLVLRGFAA